MVIGCVGFFRPLFYHGGEAYHDPAGSVDDMSWDKAKVIEVALSRIEQVAESGCWIYHGTISDQGYAVAYLNGKLVVAGAENEVNGTGKGKRTIHK